MEVKERVRESKAGLVDIVATRVCVLSLYKILLEYKIECDRVVLLYLVCL